MNTITNTSPQQASSSGQISKTTADTISKWGFMLSLISIPCCVISPASLTLSCIGASYNRTKQTTAGIIISSIMLLLLLISPVFIHFQNIQHKEQKEYMKQMSDYQKAQDAIYR